MKGIVKKHEFNQEVEGIIFVWNHDSMFTEFKNLDIQRERLGMLNDIMQYVGKFYSLKWVQQNVLQQTDDEIKQMQKDIDKEKPKYKEMGIYPESPDGQPLDASAFGDREGDEEEPEEPDSADEQDEKDDEQPEEHKIDSNKENPLTKPKLKSGMPDFKI